MFRTQKRKASASSSAAAPWLPDGTGPRALAPCPVARRASYCLYRVLVPSSDRFLRPTDIVLDCCSARVHAVTSQAPSLVKCAAATTTMAVTQSQRPLATRDLSSSFSRKKKHGVLPGFVYWPSKKLYTRRHPLRRRLGRAAQRQRHQAPQLRWPADGEEEALHSQRSRDRQRRRL